MSLDGSDVCLAIYFPWSCKSGSWSFFLWSPSHSFFLVLCLHLVEKEKRTKASSVLRAMSLQFSIFFVPARCTSETLKLSVGEKTLRSYPSIRKQFNKWLTSFFFKNKNKTYLCPKKLPLKNKIKVFSVTKMLCKAELQHICIFNCYSFSNKLNVSGVEVVCWKKKLTQLVQKLDK